MEKASTVHDQSRACQASKASGSNNQRGFYMGQKPNHHGPTRVLPAGPYSVIRVLATERSPEAPCEVTAIAHVDITLDDDGCRFGEVVCVTFGRRAGGYLSVPSVCRPMDLVRAIWEPNAPHVLAAHDLCLQRLIFPAAITAPLPWIGTLRVARRAWSDHLPHQPGEILATKRLANLSIAPSSGQALRPVARKALQVASLIGGLVASAEVRHWGASQPTATHALRPVLGVLAAEFALQAMVEMSTAGLAPLLEMPGPWDDAVAWRAVPLDDLVAFAGSNDDGSGGLALAEVRRRTAGQHVSEPQGHTPVLLRRGRFDVPEGGRCDGW